MALDTVAPRLSRARVLASAAGVVGLVLSMGCLEVAQDLGFDPAGADASPGDGEAGTGTVVVPDGSTTRTTEVRGIAVMRDRACVVLSSGAVKCWGANDGAQSGTAGVEDQVIRGDAPGEMGRRLPPALLGSGEKALKVVGGERHVCALLERGRVKCWGGNHQGQLGLGDVVPRGADQGSMGDALPVVDLGAERRAVDIFAGPNTSCAILEAGPLVCWGSAQYGHRGSFDPDGTIRDYGTAPGDMGDHLPAVDVGTDLRVKQASMGPSGTVAVLDDGRVKSWGLNISGQLGLGDMVDRKTPAAMGDALPLVDLGTGRTAKSVVAEAWVRCALLDDDTVKCWGRNDHGQLGLEDKKSRGASSAGMGDALPVVRLGSGRTVRSVVLGEIERGDEVGLGYACALLDDGRVKCWGSSGPQLGYGDAEDRGAAPGSMGDALEPVNLGSGPGARAAGIATHSGAVCALLVDGRVKCWGSNARGRLGIGDSRDRGLAPEEMGDNLPAVDLDSVSPDPG